MKVHSFSVVKRTQEFYSFVVRLSLGLCIALYFWIGMINGDLEINSRVYYNFAALYFTATLILGIDLFRNPQSKIRRYITLLFDFSCTSYAILLSGSGDSEFMLIYIWLYIAYGTRYGLPYLLSGVILVMFEYNFLLYLDQSWTNNPLGSSAQNFVLIVMPAYLYSMIKQLHIARKEAEHATMAKSSFLAIMSHEIRTPMSGIVGTAYLLQKTQQSDEQKQYTNTLVNAAKSLHTLIDDILDFSKIEAKKLILKNDSFDLHQTINEVIAVLKADAEKQSIILDSNIDSEIPSFFIGDDQRIKQVLFNLIGNAIKFTEQGKVTLNTSIIQDRNQLPADSNNLICLCFDIIDTGIGMTETQQQNIFNSFTQADNHSYDKTRTGTGLGTTISKQLVELMGGKIGVRSQLNHGSRFWFTLALPTAEQKYLENVPSNISADSISLKILIVEDEDINAMVLQSFLQNMGHTIQRELNGASALEALSKNHYDLVFMDMNIPEINGPETTRLWREKEQQNRQHPIPVIALTAYATTDNRDICINSGMDEFITKPVNPEQLSKIIEKFC